MNTKWTNILSFVLLIVAVVSSSACSMSSINAQSQRPRIIEATPNTGSTPDSSELAYKPPKRISKDIIKSEEKPAKAKTK